MSSNTTGRLAHTWSDFLRAFRSPDPFNPFLWIYRLSVALVLDLSDSTGLGALIHRNRLHRIWLPLVPLLAIILIVTVSSSYFFSLRTLVYQQWCCGNGICPEFCFWIKVHDLMVSYLTVMTLYHYIGATFTSPGVVLKPNQQPWTSWNSQGGLIGFNPIYNPKAEEKRVALYQSFTKSKSSTRFSTDTTTTTHLEFTFCKTCEVKRPPRCHHCRVCQRCILQYDHHCVWLNNCIGYNNYRHFVLAIFFLLVGCIYGMVLYWRLFYEPLKKQVELHGWHWLYINGTGFLDIPPPWQVLKMIWTGTFPADLVIKFIYPLLAGVGLVLSSFLGMHLKYTITARTTLEYKIAIQEAMVSSKPHRTPSSPFDKGKFRNLKQVLGDNLLLAFVPIHVEPPPPYFPKEH